MDVAASEFWKADINKYDLGKLQPLWYTAGPLMVAIIFMMGTKHDCNDGHERDLIWMQSQFQSGLNILAISNPKWTKYACNLVHVRPEACNVENRPRIT